MRGHLIDTVRLAIEFIRFGGGCRGYSSSISFEQKILKLEEDNQLAEEEIAKIRREFDAAKQSFFKIPDALKGMQKMDPNGIYVNKKLRLENIQVYGFDYDYTLAHYSANLQSLIYELAKEHLVNELRYPDSCLEFKYDPTFPIRGLYYDKLKGCLLKLDFFGSIEPDGCYFGQRKVLYWKIRRVGKDFTLACLIADIVQHFVDAKLEFDAPYVYQDVNRAIQHVHGSGLAHRGILSDPQRYLVKDVSDGSL
ncbi:5'-nucleotidase domain-containing protein DDB_G0275467-like [Camellia sinensis]|uniref:5'-nucleotidase domain-containing protein DDB_G0275467-like n=1 Tax=Camellia sinensis TaxID=4442 RepID=UPI0010361073|nr:5'-nucleotidase domain-containing protein DDB_G0275467-like [Camellia sinensis]